MIPDPTLGGVTTLKLPVCVCARPYNYVVCSSTNADREKEREDTHTKLTEFSFAQDAFSNKFILPKSQGIAIALGHQLNNSTRPESILKEADRQRERGGGKIVLFEKCTCTCTKQNSYHMLSMYAVYTHAVRANHHKLTRFYHTLKHISLKLKARYEHTSSSTYKLM